MYKVSAACVHSILVTRHHTALHPTDKKLVGESNSRLARYSSTKIGECMC